MGKFTMMRNVLRTCTRAKNKINKIKCLKRQRRCHYNNLVHIAYYTTQV